MSQEVTKILTKIVTKMNINFSMRESPISLAEVFSPTGLLPGLARRADQLCSLCLGYGIGVTIEEAKGTMLGVKVTFDEVTPKALRYMCILDVLDDIIRAFATKDVVPLDELLYD
jgi:intracellular multiplication protein IcmS